MIRKPIQDMEDEFMLTKRGQRQDLPARVLELGLERKVSLEKLSIWNMSIKTANLEESFFFGGIFIYAIY